MNTTLYVPKRIKVGYQNRTDTYTGSLAYIIYYDSKGVLRKETSWENWRDKKIDPTEYDNVPIEGFVLNKKVGDYCDYEHRQAYTRVYDPRGFEFEITIDNLLYILENASCIKGKGLEGEFVYAWDGKELVLLPVEAPDYKEIMEYNEKVQSNKKFNTKNLIVGGTYLTRDNEEAVYIGRYPTYGDVYILGDKTFTTWNKMVNYSEKNDVPYHKEIPNPYGWYTNYEKLYTIGKGITGKEFWFGWEKDGKWRVDHFKSANNIIDVVDEKCNVAYSEIYEAMQRHIAYSPYDPSRDEYVPYDVETLVEGIPDAPCCFPNCGYFVKVNGLIKWDSDICGKCGEEGTQGPVIKTERYSSSSGWTRETMTPEEFIEKYHPHYIKVYLQNGKLYYKGRVKPYECER